MNRTYVSFIFLILTSFNILSAQENWKKRKIIVPPPVCYASDKLEKSYIPPPEEFFLKSAADKKSEIIVTYSLFPEKAKVAFEFAVSIWEQIVESEIPIHIQANWRSQDKNVLGSAGPSEYYSNFEYAPRKNRFYPVAVAEKITKSEINPTSSPDIEATFNKDINWYFGTDSLTPDGLYNFVTVVLHEIGHGLGFTGFFYINGNQGTYGNYNPGDASAFDILVVNKDGQQLTDTLIFNTPSLKLNDAFTSASLYSNSPVAISNNHGFIPRLYAPTTWNDGSSIYHLNDATYPYTNSNSLMTHAIGKGETVHDPGPITRGIMADIGWKNMYLNLEKPKDIEEKNPIVFNLNVESDYELKTSSLFLYYSYNESSNRIDSIPLIPSETTGLFSATLNTEINSGEIYYYISATDIKKRKFFIPNNAPYEVDTIKVGPDIEVPEINHTPIPYFLLPDSAIKIIANVTDNLGVDTVYVEYSLNGIPKDSFGLSSESANLYSGSFNLNLESLNDGDEITYSIFAKDSSNAKNMKQVPADKPFSFKIQRIFEPIGGYFNNFDNPTTDFIISDFDVYTINGFENGSLNSPHPYPSPNENNKELNFSTFLKYPIILKDNSSMSFDEIVLVEPGEILSAYGDEDFWDYVIVEGSKDMGKSWLPVADGYDSGKNSNWKSNYNAKVIAQVSQAEGNPEWYITHEINVLENGNFMAGDTVLFRFRLFSDPYAHGWGWTIDNLRIQLPVSAPKTALSPGNVVVYPNPFNDILNVSIQAINNSEELTLELFTMFGQKMYSVELKNIQGEMKHEIDVSKFAGGMYFLSIQEKGAQIFSRKIIKN